MLQIDMVTEACVFSIAFQKSIGHPEGVVGLYNSILQYNVIRSKKLSLYLYVWEEKEAGYLESRSITLSLSFLKLVTEEINNIV